LLISAYAICALILVYLTLLGAQYIRFRYFNKVIIVLNLLMLVPFIWHSLLIIHLANKYYPAKEPSNLHRIGMILSVILAGILQVLIFIGFIVAINDFSRSNIRLNTESAASIGMISAILIIAILQVFNSVEGFHLIKTIRQNYRKQLWESL